MDVGDKEHVPDAGAAIVKSLRRFLKKLGIDLSHNLATPLRGLYPVHSMCYRRYTCSSVFIAALFAETRYRSGRCPLTDE